MTLPLHRGPSRSLWLADLTDDEADRALKLWDAGCDTATIAERLFRFESVVERAVRLGRERRRKEE
jgi:hypothetical protein